MSGGAGAVAVAQAQSDQSNGLGVLLYTSSQQDPGFEHTRQKCAARPGLSIPAATAWLCRESASAWLDSRNFVQTIGCGRAVVLASCCYYDVGMREVPLTPSLVDRSMLR